MKVPTKKLQITLPEEVVIQVDEEVSKTFSTRSNWFLKLALEELKKKGKNEMKKIIDLDI